MQRYFFVIIICFLFTGCATVPQKEALPTYSINGINYLALINLCETRGISWEYDTFTRRIILSKDTHRINLMVGQDLVLVDGLPKILKAPVDIYQGTVVVSYRFKEEVFDSLFKNLPLIPKKSLPILQIKRVVIDAGHGGSDPGAIGRTGTREKHITLDIAKRLSSLLESCGIEIVMTRSRDTFIPLKLRVDIANNSAADLFISIHANANRVRSLNGFEVYYNSFDTDDTKRAIDSAGNAALNLKPDCFASDSTVLKAILWDMIYTHNRAESITLATRIDRAVGSNLGIRIPRLRAANFFVLKGTQMPAILIEVGFLSNYDEERMLKNSYYRQQMANAIAEGIQNYAKELRFAEASN